jgi:DNA polymerase-3 subunit delta'
MDTVEEWLGRQARSRAGEGSARLAPLAEVWEKIARATREADRFNLDRRALVLTLFADLAEAVRRSRAA